MSYNISGLLDLHVRLSGIAGKIMELAQHQKKIDLHMRAKRIKAIVDQNTRGLERFVDAGQPDPHTMFKTINIGVFTVGFAHGSLSLMGQSELYGEHEQKLTANKIASLVADEQETDLSGIDPDGEPKQKPEDDGGYRPFNRLNNN